MHFSFSLACEVLLRAVPGRRVICVDVCGCDDATGISCELHELYMEGIVIKETDVNRGYETGRDVVDVISVVTALKVMCECVYLELSSAGVWVF